MKDLLLPRTDAGVLAQVIVAVVVFTTAAVLARHDRNVLLLVAGLATLTLGLFGVRALH